MFLSVGVDSKFLGGSDDFETDDLFAIGVGSWDLVFDRVCGGEGGEIACSLAWAAKEGVGGLAGVELSLMTACLALGIFGGGSVSSLSPKLEGGKSSSSNGSSSEQESNGSHALTSALT